MTIEDIILRHSKRGMNILREEMPGNYAEDAAKYILSWEKKNVFLTTGFYVAGFAETDGPVGTVTLARAMKELGFEPVIVTDKFCDRFFDDEDFETVLAPLDADDSYFRELVDKYKPSGMISIERCGINANNDYANMRNISIKENTSPIDRLFTLYSGEIPTVGVGDGGNEIGMGNVKEIIESKLSLVPCTVKCDKLVIATVSNWGAYGIIAYLAKITGKDIFPDYSEIALFIEKTVKIGSVDGISHERVNHVDGFDESVEEEIATELKKASR